MQLKIPALPITAQIQHDVGLKFISIHSWASADSEVSAFDRFVITGYRAIKSISLSTEAMHGPEAANIEIEKVPIQVGPQAKVKIKREIEDEPEQDYDCKIKWEE